MEIPIWKQGNWQQGTESKDVDNNGPKQCMIESKMLIQQRKFKRKLDPNQKEWTTTIVKTQ